MNVTVKHEGEVVKITLTACQDRAMWTETYPTLEDAKAFVGKQAKQVFKFLIEKGLFTETKSRGYKITPLGRKVAKQLETV